MDPISLAIGAVGLGMQIFGGIGATEDAQKASQISKDEARQEQGISDQKQQAMEIDARRRGLEQMRQTQQAQSLAISRATNQNAQFGSGLQGGLAEVSNQGNFNLQGINQSLQIGRTIAGLNNNISNDKYQMADVQSDEATNKGIMSLGGSLMSAGPTIGKLSQGFGKSNSFGFLMGGGSPTGYGS